MKPNLPKVFLVILAFSVFIFVLDALDVKPLGESISRIAYFFLLVLGAVYGWLNFKFYKAENKIITLIFTFLITTETLAVYYQFFGIKQGIAYTIVTLGLILFNYMIFGRLLKFKHSQRQIFRNATFLLFALVLLIQIFIANQDEFPFIGATLFCFYVITLSLYSFLQIIKLPAKKSLWNQPLFLYAFSNLFLYCTNFWKINARPLFYKIPVSSMLENKTLLVDVQAAAMVFAYSLMFSMLFMGDRRETEHFSLNDI